MVETVSVRMQILRRDQQDLKLDWRRRLKLSLLLFYRSVFLFLFLSFSRCEAANTEIDLVNGHEGAANPSTRGDSCSTLTTGVACMGSGWRQSCNQIDLDHL
jgi:hypothetical protein